MPQLRPFRALRYDLRAVADAGVLLCPPYDVISAAERRRLAALHPHNAVHLELPQDDAGRADYQRAAQLFAAWQADGVLKRDEHPAVYAYEQVYPLPDGALASARGFFCLLGLERFGAGSGVRAHERTMAGPKQDRLELLRAVRANLSPVLLLYEGGDDGSRSRRLLAELMSGPADLQTGGPEGPAQRLWAVRADGSDVVRQLLEHASGRPLTIADGHHRYETALAYRNEQDVPKEADWLLVLLFDAASGGLSVLPTHRLVQAQRDPADVLAAAGRLFELEPVADNEELVHATREPGRLGLWTASGCWLLRPRYEAIEPLLPAGASEVLRWLDVTVLTSTLSALVGEQPGALLEAGRLDYVKDPAEVLARAAACERGYAFVLPPTPVPAVLQVAAVGEQMPHKSTYFEPKPATGLVFNPLVP